MGTRLTDLEAVYLPTIRALPFVKSARLESLPAGGPDTGVDAILDLATTTGPRRLGVHVLGSHLGRTLIQHLSGILDPGASILFVPYVSRPSAEALGAMGLNFVDRVGNVRLALGDQAFVTLLGGRSPPRAPGGTRGWRQPGLLALFAFLARPELLDAPVRVVAEEVGISKNAVADARIRLVQDRFLVETSEGRKLVDRRRLLERWLSGFADSLWPGLVLGRFRTAARSPVELERHLEALLSPSELRWAWGGGPAAERLVGHYRGETTTVWIERLPVHSLAQLRALPDREGPLVFVRAPGSLVFEGAVPATVHPLLVYAELLARGDDRAAETAHMIGQKFPGVVA